jgi:hypothetical protein
MPPQALAERGGAAVGSATTRPSAPEIAAAGRPSMSAISAGRASAAG